jgi:hypothetical protein
MAVWAVTIPAFWYVIPHNARDLAGRDSATGRMAAALRHSHGAILTGWLLIVAGLVAERFWAPWDPVFA